MKKIRKRSIRKKNATIRKIGLPPGSIIHEGEIYLDNPEISVTDYDSTSVEHTTLRNPVDLYPFMENNERNTWVKFTGIHDTKTISEIGSHLEIHPLVLEDVVNTGQRPKVEYYDDYIYVVVPHLGINPETQELEKKQVSLIISKGCVISYHENKDDIFNAIKPRIEIPNGRFKRYGSDYLLYAIIDLVVDNYFRILDEFNEELLTIEEKMINEQIHASYEELHLLRRKFIQMRRYISPMHEVIVSLIRDDTTLITDEVKVYYRDVNDHLNRVSENLDHIIEITVTMFETHMAQLNIRTGEVMKVLTIIATIFIPLTFVAGIYGMNFDPEVSPWNMPELGWYYGYPAIMGVMLLITLGMLYYFHRKKWI